MEPQWDGAAGYLCSVQQGWAEATLPPGVLTTSNLSPLPPPCFFHPYPLNGTFAPQNSISLLTPFSFSLPSSSSYGRLDQRWRYPARQWACTLRRSCKRYSRAKAFLKHLSLRSRTKRKRRTMTQMTLRRTSYSPDANGWKQMRKCSTSSEDQPQNKQEKWRTVFSRPTILFLWNKG